MWLDGHPLKKLRSLVVILSVEEHYKKTGQVVSESATHGVRVVFLARRAHTPNPDGTAADISEN